MLFTEKIKELRIQYQMPQRQIAAALDIDTATYCKIENGKYSPSKDQIEKVAEILNCQIHELIKTWLADKIIQILEDDANVALEALQLAYNSIDGFHHDKDLL